jgi:hypothetical protein
MPDDAIERLFSLFTSSDRAVAMAGDLTEERERRGWIWYWLHVIRITFVLWRNVAMEAPLRVLALVVAGLALLAAPAFGGVASVFLFPQMVGSLAGWIALPFFWWGGALWTGASMVAFAPRRGMAACAVLVAIGEGLLIAFAGPAVWRDPGNRDFVLFCTTALIAAMPLLTGAAVARRRLVARAPLPS